MMSNSNYVNMIKCRSRKKESGTFLVSIEL